MNTKNEKAPAVTEALEKNTQSTDSRLAAELVSPAGAQLLDKIAQFARRFVVMSDADAWFTALWIAHTHCKFDPDDCTFRTTPYFWISSATKESGKTTLMRVLKSLSRDAVKTDSISVGAMNRVVEEIRPTLLLDELDRTMKGNKERSEALNCILNAGFEYDGAVMLCVGDSHKIATPTVYCPKALAGIGKLWDTVASRSIPVRLERKLPGDQVEYFDREIVDPEADELRKEIAWWIEMVESTLRARRPESELDGRVQDLWRPLFAVADTAGGEWPARARQAARELSTGEAREDEDLGVRLLADIRTIFTESEGHVFKSADLIAKLAEIEESPWGDWAPTGKPITVQKLAGLLHRWRIKTMSVWVDARTERGYKREQFENAWARHLDDPPEEGGRCSRGSRDESPSQATPTAPTTPTAYPGGVEADQNGSGDRMDSAKTGLEGAVQESSLNGGPPRCPDCGQRDYTDDGTCRICAILAGAVISPHGGDVRPVEVVDEGNPSAPDW
jgi:hypothetical protein